MDNDFQHIITLIQDAKARAYAKVNSELVVLYFNVGNKDYYTDLLFYHRDLQCLVLFELKIQDFEPEFLGKLNFYLEALDRDVKRPHENPSIGILLCKGKDNDVVEYALARNISPTIIAEYQTKLIDKGLLIDKLNQLISLLSPRFNSEIEL